MFTPVEEPLNCNKFELATYDADTVVNDDDIQIALAKFKPKSSIAFPKSTYTSVALSLNNDDDVTPMKSIPLTDN